jgi:hypothetical protein
VQPSRLQARLLRPFEGAGWRSETAQRSGRAPTTAGANSRVRGGSRGMISRRRAAVYSGPSRAPREWRAQWPAQGPRNGASGGARNGARNGARAQIRRASEASAQRRIEARLLALSRARGWRASDLGSARSHCERVRTAPRNGARNGTRRGTKGRGKRREARRKSAPREAPKNFEWAPGSSAGANFFRGCPSPQRWESWCVVGPVKGARKGRKPRRKRAPDFDAGALLRLLLWGPTREVPPSCSDCSPRLLRSPLCWWV